MLRYVAVLETKDPAVLFYNYINRKHSNIKFTMETEKKKIKTKNTPKQQANKKKQQNKDMIFLDFFVCSKPNLVTSVCRKTT